MQGEDHFREVTKMIHRRLRLYGGGYRREGYGGTAGAESCRIWNPVSRQPAGKPETMDFPDDGVARDFPELLCDQAGADASSPKLF